MNLVSLEWLHLSLSHFEESCHKFGVLPLRNNKAENQGKELCDDLLQTTPVGEQVDPSPEHSGVLEQYVGVVVVCLKNNLCGVRPISVQIKSCVDGP